MFARTLLLLALLLAPLPALSDQGDRLIKTSWLGEFEAFPAWYAAKTGIDGRHKLKIDMGRVPTGKNLIDNMGAFGWNIAGVGGVPALDALMDNSAYGIALATDEAAANHVFTAPGAKANAARALRGQTLLCPLGTNAHQTMLAWLAKNNVPLEDVLLVDSDPAKVVPILAGGFGAAGATWSPHALAAEKPLELAATGSQLGIRQPILLLAESSWADREPEKVGDFLKVWFEAVDGLQGMDKKERAELYKQFMAEFSGIELSLAECMKELDSHPFMGRGEHERIAAKGPGKQEIMDDVAAFSRAARPLGKRQEKQLEELEPISPRFLP